MIKFSSVSEFTGNIFLLLLYDNILMGACTAFLYFVTCFPIGMVTMYDDGSLKRVKKKKYFELHDGKSEGML